MQVITPLGFENSQLYSTTATETHPTYDNTNTYNLGDKVVYNLDTVYESLVNTNTGNTPGVDATKWLKIGPSNKYAMFDTSVSTRTISTNELVVKLRPGKVYNSIAFLNLTGQTLNVTITDTPGGTEIFNHTYSLVNTSSIIDWYSYFFGTFDPLDTVVITNIPPYSASEITVTLNAIGTVAIGEMICGNIFGLGFTQYGANLGVRDFSIKDTDEFGTVTLVKRDFSRRLNANIEVRNAQLNFVYKQLNNIRATPTVWIPTPYSGYESMIVYGYCKDYSIAVEYPQHSLLSLEIEGLT